MQNVQSEVTAWHLEMVVPGVHDKFYRIYLVETPNAGSMWFSQWGKRGSFGQWQSHADGFSSRSRAQETYDAKLSKGYVVVARKSFKINSDFRSSAPDLNRAFRETLKDPEELSVTDQWAKSDLEAVEQSLKDMLKRAGRGR